MGGLGSTRWQGHIRRTWVSEVPRIDLRPLFKAATGPRSVDEWGVVTSGPSFTYSINLTAAVIELTPHGGHPICLDLSATECHLGGRRWWALCPACARRIAVVFYTRRGVMQCRKCADLGYRSQVEPRQPGDRLLARIRHIKVKVGGREFDRVLGPFPRRPHWMARTRYRELASEVERLWSLYQDEDLRRAAALRERRLALEAEMRLETLSDLAAHAIDGRTSFRDAAERIATSAGVSRGAAVVYIAFVREVGRRRMAAGLTRSVDAHLAEQKRTGSRGNAKKGRLAGPLRWRFELADGVCALTVAKGRRPILLEVDHRMGVRAPEAIDAVPWVNTFFSVEPELADERFLRRGHGDQSAVLASIEELVDRDLLERRDGRLRIVDA